MLQVSISIRFKVSMAHLKQSLWKMPRSSKHILYSTWDTLPMTTINHQQPLMADHDTHNSCLELHISETELPAAIHLICTICMPCPQVAVSSVHKLLVRSNLAPEKTAQYGWSTRSPRDCTSIVQAEFWVRLVRIPSCVYLHLLLKLVFFWGGFLSSGRGTVSKPAYHAVSQWLCILYYEVASGVHSSRKLVLTITNGPCTTDCTEIKLQFRPSICFPVQCMQNHNLCFIETANLIVHQTRSLNITWVPPIKSNMCNWSWHRLARFH